MIDLTSFLVPTQIAYGIAIIAFVLVWKFFVVVEPDDLIKSKKKNKIATAK